MKRILFSLIVAVVFAGSAATSATAGTEVISGDNGSMTTVHRVGSKAAFISHSDGSSATVQRIGGSVFVSNSDRSTGLIQKIGNTTFTTGNTGPVTIDFPDQDE